MSIEAPGFMMHRHDVLIPMDPLFPGVFAPVDLGVIALRRNAATLTGRVTRLAVPDPVPISGASIRVTGIWRNPPPAILPPPPDPANIIFVSPGAALQRSAATANVRARNLTPVAGQDKELVGEALEKSLSVRISDRVGIGVGSILTVDPEDVGRTEHFTAASVAGGITVNEPATVSLDVGLLRRHRRGAMVRPMTAAAPGANNALADDIESGDVSLLLSSMSGLAGASHIEVDDGIAPREFHTVQLYETVTSTEGFYALPPIHRVAQLQITADDGVNPPSVTTVRLDYTRESNRHDITIP
jgi:hypothetical protein